MASTARAQFVHPGGLHTQADLDRMKTQVAAGAHPWIDDWNLLIQDPLAQNTYVASPIPNMGNNRQLADQDAHAAYLQALRWYISGDTSYADNAVKILNAWAQTVNVAPSDPGTTNFYGLEALPIEDFAIAGEVLRLYLDTNGGGWKSSDFAVFQNMFTQYLSVSVYGFLDYHNEACISFYWPSWDSPNLDALIAMGVLTDNQQYFNDGVSYFKYGFPNITEPWYNGAPDIGNGVISNSVINQTTLPSGEAIGQDMEIGRDQEHAQLAFGAYGYAAQIAWNQGTDLFSYQNNAILDGAEYLASYAQQNTVPFQLHNDCVGDDLLTTSINGRGRLDDRPIWELLYNHYVVLEGVTTAPAVTNMANLYRPEVGSDDHLGYGTLTFTLSGTASPFPVLPTPTAPTGLTATSGVGQIALKWVAQPNTTGFIVLRSTAGGAYTTLTTLTLNTTPSYIDTTTVNGTLYSYEVEATNKNGVNSAASAAASATSVPASALPTTWQDSDVGTVTTPGYAVYASTNNGTFLVTGQGSGIGGPGGGLSVSNTSTSDSFNFAYQQVTGDFILTARLANFTGTDLNDTGLMIRETLNANASAFSIGLGNLGARYTQVGIRNGTGASTTWVGGNLFTYTPIWYRLQRAGNTFTAYQSQDAVTWFTIATATIAMNSTYYVGLAAASGDTTGGTTETSTFDNVSAVGTVNTPTPVTLIPNGTYVIENRNSGLPLEDPGSSTSYGQLLDQGALTNGSNQQWTVTNLGNNVITLANGASGQAADVAGASTNVGALVDQWAPNGQTNQQWQVVDVGSGLYQLISVNSGLALDVVASSTTVSAQIDQTTYEGNSSQQWSFTPPSAIVLPTFANGTYEITSLATGLALENPTFSQWQYGIPQNVNVVTDSAIQHWLLTNLGNNIVTLENADTNQNLDVVGSSTLPGAIVQDWPADGGTNQEWKVVSVGNNAYELVSVNSGLALDVIDGSTAPGAGVDQAIYTGVGTQQWVFTVPSQVVIPTLIPNGTYEITSTASGLALENPSFSQWQDGVQQNIGIVTDSAIQNWVLTNLGNNIVTLQNVDTNQLLEVAGASTQSGAVVDDWPSNGGTNQQWQVVLAGVNTFALLNVNSGLALDVSGGSPTPGTPMDQAAYASLGSQQWVFTPPSQVVLPSLPTGWWDLDVGGPGAKGSASYNNGVFTVNGSGYDIWGSYDYFNYLSEFLSGNFTVTARIDSQTSPNGGGKAGLMVRQTDDNNAPYVFIDQTPTNVNMQDRTVFSGGVSYTTINGVTAPYWQQITRDGNNFTTSVSPDGVNWETLGTATVDMTDPVLVGFAVTSQDNTVLSTATFDQFSVNNGTVAVAPASGTLTAGTVGTSYSQSFTASGGTSPYTYQVTAGSLPPGLALSTGGALTGTPTTAGSYSFTVAALDSHFLTGSQAYSITVNKGAATVALSNLSQTYTGSALAAIATTTPANLAVSFTYNGSSIAPTTAGSYAVVATVNDPNYTGSATGILAIAKAASAVSFTANPASPLLGQSDTLSATVTGAGQISGTVAFVSGSSTLCTATLNASGAGSCSFTPATDGNLAITAQYQGDANHTTSSSSQTLFVYDPAVQLQLASTQLTYPGATNVTVCVAAATTASATGSVKIYDGTTLLTTLTVQGGGCAYWYISPGLSAGTHTLTAVYSRDSNNPGGTSVPVVVTVNPVAVTLAASCWNASFAYGGSYTCTVSLSSNAGSATGNLTYTVDGGTPNSIALSSGSAQFTIPTPNAGNHTVVLSYAAQGNFAAAGPVNETFTVTPAPTQIQLTPSSYYQSASSPLTLTASLTSWSAGAPKDGTVAFYDGTTLLGTVAAGATVNFTVSGLAVGTHSFQAVYSPGASGDFAAATSSTASVQLTN
jgi:regulation of enolase protein 1 (concanavalin A-like superfamily)